MEEPVVDSPAVVLAGKAVSNDDPSVPTVTGMSDEEEEEGEEVVISLRKRAPAVCRPLGWPAAKFFQGWSSVIGPLSSMATLDTAQRRLVRRKAGPGQCAPWSSRQT